MRRYTLRPLIAIGLVSLLFVLAEGVVIVAPRPGRVSTMLRTNVSPAFSAPLQATPAAALQVPMQTNPARAARTGQQGSACQQMPSAHTCTGVLPTDAGCVDDVQDLPSVFFFHQGVPVGWARKRFSPSCGTTWIKAVGYQASGIASVSIDSTLAADPTTGSLHSDSAGQDDQQEPLQVFSPMVFTRTAQIASVQSTVTFFFADSTSQEHSLQ